MLNRRNFLTTATLALRGVAAQRFLSAIPSGLKLQVDSGLPVEGAVLNVHDPVMIKHNGKYYLFCTGAGIAMRRSPDKLTWRIARGGLVFPQLPQEGQAYVPTARDLWAPDISFYNNRYHLYYSISTFGSNHSAIGLATNPTLDPDDEQFEWTDHGIVIQSQASDFYNAIDPNLILDENDQAWLAFGSFWGGIQLVQLDYGTGKLADANEPVLHALATREENSRSVEAPFIIKRQGFYYLFVSFDFCCRGLESTYHVRVGRSQTITGPYLDREGVPMLEGGGTQVTFPTNRFKGPGHNAIFHEDGQDYIVYHAYDAQNGGIPILRIQPLIWDADGWVTIA